MTANSKYNDLIEALRQGETAEVEALTQKALDSGANPLDLIQSVLVPTLTDVGNQFQAFTIFLPELMAAGEAATAATAIIEEAIAASGQKTSSPGTVLLGTVESDVHDIGKNIVNTLLSSHGFKVIDLGVDVNADRFMIAIRESKPDILALSSLMTTTAAEMKKVIDTLKREKLREKIKIIVGGGPITEAFSQEIGADGFSSTAPGGAKLARKLIGK